MRRANLRQRNGRRAGSRPTKLTRGVVGSATVLALVLMVAGGISYGQEAELPLLAVEEVDSTSLAAGADLAVNDITSQVRTGSLDASQAEVLLAGGDTSQFYTIAGGSRDEYANAVVQTADAGYIVAGSTSSYGAGEEDLFLLKFDATGALEWARTAGGAFNDWACAVAQTTDQGYVVAGSTLSYGAGYFDVFLVKYDAGGNLTWAKAVGGAGGEVARSLQRTTDGGTIVTGYTTSHGAGSADVLLLKFASNGALSWARTAGGSNGDEGEAVHLAENDGYIVAGYTYSHGAGGFDVFVLKYNAGGTLLWARTAGGRSDDMARSVTQAPGGGYVVAGTTYSYGEGESDALLLKYDEDGGLVWARTAGGTAGDEAHSVAATDAGGFVVAGYTASYSEGTYADALLLWYDAGGALVRARAIGDSDDEIARSVAQTDDGGFIFAGDAYSYGTPDYNWLQPALFLLKTDAQGSIRNCDACRPVQPTTHSPAPLESAPVVWTSGPTDFAEEGLTPETDSPSPVTLLPCGRLFLVAAGGSGLDAARAVQPTSDGGYVVAGSTETYGAGGRDVFLLKFDSSGRLVWARTAGAGGYDSATSVAQTSDGGYVLAGHTGSFSTGLEDILLLKFDANGQLSWARTAAGDDEDYASAVAQTSDDGYIVAGYTWSFGAGSYDVLLLKYDSGGTLSWAKTAGGGGNDQAHSVAQTTDEGYIVAGSTNSYGANGSALLIKYSSSGSLTWMLAIGGSGSDHARSVAQTRDGGYVVAGSTLSYGAGGSDVFLLKFDSGGWLSWATVAGGAQPDSARSVRQTADGGYIVAGETESYGAGGKDAFLLNYNGQGTLRWARTVGGEADDSAYSVEQSPDRGYVLAGNTRSYGAGEVDVLLTKTDRNGKIPECDLCQSVSPATYTPSSPGVSSYTMSQDAPSFATGAPTLTSGPASPGAELLCSSVRRVFLPLVTRG